MNFLFFYTVLLHDLTQFLKCLKKFNNTEKRKYFKINVLKYFYKKRVYLY